MWRYGSNSIQDDQFERCDSEDIVQSVPLQLVQEQRAVVDLTEVVQQGCHEAHAHHDTLETRAGILEHNCDERQSSTV